MIVPKNVKELTRRINSRAKPKLTIRALTFLVEKSGYNSRNAVKEVKLAVR